MCSYVTIGLLSLLNNHQVTLAFLIQSLNCEDIPFRPSVLM